jgi:hypothetical protein
MLKRFTTLTLVAFALICNAQIHNIKVFSDSRFEFKYPWAGGMNSCQFGQIDLNLDGTKDLIVFDRVGDRIMPFLVISESNNFDYQYAPEFSSQFPLLTQWAVFEDYNLDGKTDIFTYSPGYAGMKVYRNTSDSELEFRLEVFPFLKSFQGGGYINILVTYADYPAITDLDGDGDLDILTFWGLGSFVEKHRNMSIEKYGHADSLDFEKTDYCWGYFAESDETNEIKLDTCLRCMEAWKHGGMDYLPSTADRHTGSTFRILDLNGDQLPDLLLGDVDYPNLIALYNSGNGDTARMTSYDWQYPAGNQPVNLFTMPAAYYDDFNFDGIKDLLVSPFDPNPFLPENFRSNWLYSNEGTGVQPVFNLQTKSFLQRDMLDFGAGAYPVLFDLDRDGLTDILAGNYGYYDTSYFDEFLILHTEQKGQLAFLRNTGTVSQPAFTLADRDLASISQLGLTGIAPAFGDLDGDGDPDMLAGSETGQLIYYENVAEQGNQPEFEMKQENFQDIDVGAYSAPVLFDLDRDNLQDLVIGEKGGNLNYYRNTGSLQNPLFELVTDSLGKINVTDYNVSLDGYSMPYFYRDESDQTHLLIGSEQGLVLYYTGIDENLEGEFTLSDTLAGLIGLEEIQADFGYRSSPALHDLDQDGYPEIVCGNFSGGLNYISKNTQSPVNHIGNDANRNAPLLKIYPNPAYDQITLYCPDYKEYESVEICLYDPLGRLSYHYSGQVAENLSIDAASFPPGVYIFKITFIKGPSSEENRIFRKVLVY